MAAQQQDTETLHSVLRALATSEAGLRACLTVLQNARLSTAESAALSALCADVDLLCQELAVLAIHRYGRSWRAPETPDTTLGRPALGLALAGGEGLRRLLADVASHVDDGALVRAAERWSARRSSLVDQLLGLQPADQTAA